MNELKAFDKSSKKEWFIKSPAGGSLTVKAGEHNERFKYWQDVLGFGLPTLAGLHNDTSVSYTEIAERIFDSWKDVPWKGDLLVRIKPATIKEDIARYYETLGKSPKQATFVDKFVNIPQLVFANLSTRALRASYYMDATHTVTLYNKNFYVAMHEMGHALDYDPHVATFKDIHKYKARKKGLVARLQREWQASANAMKHLKTDEERRKAMKVLEPAFGTYIGAAIGKLATYALMATEFLIILPYILNPTLLPLSVFTASLQRKLFMIAAPIINAWVIFPFLGTITGALGGRVLSVLRDRKSTFGYAFSGSEQSDLHVQYVGTGKPAYAWNASRR